MKTGHTRRETLGLLGAGVGLLGASCSAATAQRSAKNQDPDPEEEVSPGEDLMREHGVLRRILLVYDEGLRRLDRPQPAVAEPLGAAARLVRRFVEDYHEKLEEEQLVPRFEKAGRLVPLVTTLRQQHQVGRKLTDAIQKTATATKGEQAQRLGEALRQFIRMYQPHAAWEDTVLFPAFQKLVGEKEYRRLGEAFEDQEHALLGEEGFEKAVAEVAHIEQALGINDLSAFTPRERK